MTLHISPFKIGQSVRLIADPRLRNSGLDVYTVLRCNEEDGAEPSYVIENELDHRQRREPHSRLRSVASDGSLGSQVFVHRTSA